MAGRRLTGARLFDQGQGANFRSAANIPINPLPEGEFVAPIDTFGQAVPSFGGGLQPLNIQPLPMQELTQALPEQLPPSQRFYLTEEPGQAPKLSNVPTGSPYERELQLPEQRAFEVDGREVTVSGDRPLDVGGREVLTQALAPEAPPEEITPKGSAFEQAQDLFNQMQAEGVASEFQEALKETGLDQAMKFEEMEAKRKPRIEGAKEVQSSKILPGGLTQITYKDGSIGLKSLDEAQRELVKQAEVRGSKLQGLRAGEREEAKTASKKAAESHKNMTSIKKNIINLDEAITALDEGANTGAIASRLPSIEAASLKLDQIQGELGLDVVGMTTFGALSESELAFAKDVALPLGLNEPELRKWLSDKKAAQEKVVANLEEAAIFLGTPGNTLADFLKMKKAEQPKVTEEAPLSPEEQAELEELRRRFS
jgi:hypothetical protein